ncbi:hypothetical protein MKX03_010848 [Papaver bracteatum]|nr:hypothetical protein MKX03_010848 [Papaver bracteatum]
MIKGFFIFHGSSFFFFLLVVKVDNRITLRTNFQVILRILCKMEKSRNSEQVSITEQWQDNQVNQEDNEYNFDGYEPLLEALKAQHWGAATKYIRDHRAVVEEIFKARDSKKEIYNILVRVMSFHPYKFIEEFLKLVPPEKLEYVRSGGYSVLHLAAAIGDIKFVKLLVKKHSNLTQILGDDRPCVPLFMPAGNNSDGQKEVLEYLYDETKHKDPKLFCGEHGAVLLFSLMRAGTAISLCSQFPELVKEIMDRIYENGGDMTALLQTILRRPFAFLTGFKRNCWERCIYGFIKVDIDRETQMGLKSTNVTTEDDEENLQLTPEVSCSLSELCPSTSNYRTIAKCISFNLMRCIRRGCNKKLYHHIQVVELTKIFLEKLHEKVMDKASVKDIFLKSKMLDMAMQSGMTVFVLECLREFPFLCLDDEDDEVGHILIKLVAEERNEVIYNFMSTLKQRHLMDRFSNLDKDNNSILHFSAGLPRQLKGIGAVFQMQGEKQWFKGVEHTMLQQDRFVRNKDGDTAQFLFTKNHTELMEKGEKWMKEMSGSCMVISALIATVAFAAAITVPGGNISDNNSSKNGLPVFLNDNIFMVFAIADASALSFSITSVLMFLAVYTSRYSENDFLIILPLKLITGLAALFISMITILVSFGAAFTIVLGQRFHWAPIVVSLFCCVPVLCFACLQLPLLVKMVTCTYCSTIIGKQDPRIFEPYMKKKDGIR